MPFTMLVAPDGLANRMYVLESQFGPEDPDLQEDALGGIAGGPEEGVKYPSTFRVSQLGREEFPFRKL